MIESFQTLTTYIDMRLFVTSVLLQEPWKYDSKVIPMPWRQAEADIIKSKLASGGLIIGYFNCDGNVSPHFPKPSKTDLKKVLPHPPILRGIETVVRTLKNAGHNVIPWTPYKHDYAVDLINNIYASDGGTDVFATLAASGEPAIPNFADLLNPSLPKIDMNTLWDTHLKKWAYQCEYLEQFRLAEDAIGTEIDAIVMPITPTAAVRHNQFKYYGYASAINLLDFTSVVVPVTYADKKVDREVVGYKPLNELDGVVQREYDAEAYHGAPVAVQVVGRRLTEERIMAIAEEIGRLLGNEITP